MITIICLVLLLIMACGLSMVGVDLLRFALEDREIKRREERRIRWREFADSQEEVV